MRNEVAIGRSITVIAVLGVIAALYFAKAVFLPLALAILLTFLLAPAVRLLQNWRLPRLPAVVLVVAKVGRLGRGGASQTVYLKRLQGMIFHRGHGDCEGYASALRSNY